MFQQLNASVFLLIFTLKSRNGFKVLGFWGLMLHDSLKLDYFGLEELFMFFRYIECVLDFDHLIKLLLRSGKRNCSLSAIRAKCPWILHGLNMNRFLLAVPGHIIDLFALLTLHMYLYRHINLLNGMFLSLNLWMDQIIHFFNAILPLNPSNSHLKTFFHLFDFLLSLDNLFFEQWVIVLIKVKNIF